MASWLTWTGWGWFRMQRSFCLAPCSTYFRSRCASYSCELFGPAPPFVKSQDDLMIHVLLVACCALFEHAINEFPTSQVEVHELSGHHVHRCRCAAVYLSIFLCVAPTNPHAKFRSQCNCPCMHASCLEGSACFHTANNAAMCLGGVRNRGSQGSKENLAEMRDYCSSDGLQSGRTDIACVRMAWL
eukprot:1788753-Amphidinium_carterae.1